MISEAHEESLMQTVVPHRLVVDDKQLHLTEENRAAKYVQMIADLVRDISNETDSLFSLVRRLDGRLGIKSVGKGGRLVQALSGQLALIEELLTGNAYNPFVELLREQLRKAPLLHGMPSKLTAFDGNDAPTFCTALNQLVIDLRREARTEEFRRVLDNRRRQCQKNQKAAVRMINQIFERRSKVLVIRLDLVVGGETPETRGVAQSVSVKDARRSFAGFVRYLRETYPCLGYIYNLEYGVLTGYHFHVLIFMDGHLKWGDVAIAEQLGKHWRNTITEGRGRYWNCNAHPLNYQRLGVGMILRSDAIKRKHLVEDVLPYLTSKDFWLRLSGARKSFGKARCPIL